MTEQLVILPCMELWLAFLNIHFELLSSISSGEWPVKCCIFGMRFVSSAGYHMTTQIDGFIWLITSYKNTSKLVCKVCCHQRVLTFKGFKLPLQGQCDSLCTPPTSIRATMRLKHWSLFSLGLWDWNSIEHLLLLRKWKCGCIQQWWSNTWYIFNSRSFVRGQISIPPFQSCIGPIGRIDLIC